MSIAIEAKHLSKHFKHKTALDDVSFSLERGRILGLIGPNGAGKTTLLTSIMGLNSFKGELSVAGLDPSRQRKQLMEQVCFIADVAVLPRWLKVKQAVDFVSSVHPRFNRAKCEQFLSRTNLSPRQQVKQLSKGMIVQLHLALVMAIDVPILVLDEPTLGLDILYRKQFYQSLLEDYFDEEKTIIISSHQVEEIEHIITDLMFLSEGRIILDIAMEDLGQRYVELITQGDNTHVARGFGPMDERHVLGKTIFLFEDTDITQLESLGELRQPSVSDLFMALLKGIYA